MRHNHSREKLDANSPDLSLLHRCRVSPDAVAKRDEMVFQAAHDAGVPICMALSGGYAEDSAGVISKCIERVVQKFGLIQPSSKV